MAKMYNDMTHEERVELITRMADYQNNDIDKLLACGQIFQEEDKERFMRGVELLSHFPQCYQFARLASTVCSNYDQFANTLVTKFRIIVKHLSSSVPMQEVDGASVIIMPQSQKLRRGRPTEEESRQRENEKKNAALAMAVAALVDAKIAVQENAPIASRESDTSRRKEQGADLFQTAVEDFITDGTGMPNDELKSLREWKWLLPEALALKVGQVKSMRDDIAVYSERSKQLLLEGASEKEIEECASKAKSLNTELAEIYQNVDSYLATLFVLLSEVNKDYANLAARYEKKGGYEVLLNDLRPYYEKLISYVGEQGTEETVRQALLAKANKMNEAYNTSESRDTERAKELHAIKSYFTRKDVSPSPARLSKLKTYYERAKELDADADTLSAFEVFISKTEEDINKNNQ